MRAGEMGDMRAVVEFKIRHDAVHKGGHIFEILLISPASSHLMSNKQLMNTASNHAIVKRGLERARIRSIITNSTADMVYLD